MTHKDAFKKMMEGPLEEGLVQILYGENAGLIDNVHVQGFDNVRERHPPVGTHKATWIENDAILIFIPARKNCAASKDIRPSSVAIEVKDSYEDLLKDTKMPQYVGANNLFFLAVPSVLVIPALEKIDEFAEAREKIGLINYDTGEVIILPAVDRDFDRARNAKLMAACMYSPKRCAGEESAYNLHKVPIAPVPLQHFTPYKDRLVNDVYLRLLRHIDFAKNRVQ